MSPGMGWVEYKKALLPECEPQQNISISRWEARKLLKKHKAMFLRYTTSFDRYEESPAYYVIKSEFKGLEELSSKTRNQVRKALNACEVRPIGKEVLISDGMKVYCAANEARGKEPISHDEYCRMIQNSVEREWFGCFDKDSETLIGYSQNIVGNCAQYSAVYVNPAYNKTHYPYYALFYRMNEYYLSKMNKLFVCDGFRTLDGHSNIQDFLIEKFKFRKAYCELHVVYKWWLACFVKVIFPIRKAVKNSRAQALLFQEELARGSAAT